MTKHPDYTRLADSASHDIDDQTATEIRPEPKFKVGQIVILKNTKRQPPFRILAMQWSMGSWFYAWNRRNYAAETMIRELNNSSSIIEKEK